MSRTVYVAMAAHLAQPNHTLATCWMATLRNETVVRLTSHDEDIPITGWLGDDLVLNGTYLTVAGYTATDTTTSAALNVDNMEVYGPQQLPSIVENDLNAGLWDKAQINIFSVNWRDTTMGPIWHRCGHLGEVSLEREAFKAEARGLSEAYKTRLGELTSPGCRNKLGDANCRVDLVGGSPSLTLFGAFTSVHPDGVTLYDSSRTEPGPTGGVAITGVSNANPGVVTMVDASLGLIDKQLIQISGVLGPALVNVVTLAINPSGVTFQLTVDTSDTAVYPVYAGGGLVDIFGGDTGYYDNGVITILDVGSPTSLNAGLSREIKSYAPGQITLFEPFPYTVNVGDSYSIVPGCNKIMLGDCKLKFNNVINFRGEAWLAGTDKMVQVARHNT